MRGVLVLLPLVCSGALLPLIPPAPFSHKGRRGSLGVLMAETGDGMQGPAKKPADVSFLSASLFPYVERVAKYAIVLIQPISQKSRHSPLTIRQSSLLSQPF